MSNNLKAADDGESKERLSSKEFLDLIPHLAFSQMLQIEIYYENEWKSLISEAKPKTFCCTPCGVYQSTSKNMIAHVSGKKHAIVMNSVKQIFHPLYTYPKSVESRQQNGNSKPLIKETCSNAKSSERCKPAENNQDKEATKKMVVNLLKGKRINESTKAIETITLVTNAVEPTTEDFSKIPEIIIIDDNDDDRPSEKTPKEDIKQQPPPKKPRIKVASFGKCIVNSPKTNGDENSNKEKYSEVNKEIKSSKTKNEKDKESISGFVGVEYVVKICGDNVPWRYVCALCELNLGFDDMQKHLLGYGHRLKFCEKHFPTAIQQFRQYIVNVPQDEHYKVMIPVLQKLAEAIEKHYGRAKPYECTRNRHLTQRIQLLSEVFERPHASEQDGPTFTQVVNSKDVDQFISERNATNQHDKKINGPLFDTVESTKNEKVGSNIPVVERKSYVDNHSMVEMASPMSQHFHISQPYHYEEPFTPQPFVELQPYGGQQPYVHQQQPYMQQKPSYNHQPIVDDETHKRMVNKFLKANNRNDRPSLSRSHPYDRHDRRAHYRDNTKRSTHLSRSPTFSSSSGYSALSKTQQTNNTPEIWRSYFRLVDHKLEALNECFQQYRANPESHPSHSDEWNKFWHRRKNELLALGKDYRTHDYQREWTVFFKNRIEELFNEEFESLKIQSREELSLPFTNDHVFNSKYYVHRKSSENREREKSIEYSTAVSNVESASELRKNASVINQNPSSIEAEKSKFSKQSSNSTDNIRIEDDETPTFVSVLRLFTALEEHLGSLGPKIVDLLTKALQAEKVSSACALALINEENCTLLETAMEKFKGLVIVGILDSAKERAVKRAIAKVSAFLEVAKKTRELVTKLPVPTFVQPVLNETSRKTQVIGNKIAAVDRAHLEQLATVCMLIEKKKREAAAALAENQASTSRSQPPVQKTLSDVLSDIMRPSSTSTSSSASYANENSMNSNKNVATLNNRSVTSAEQKVSGWQRQQHDYQQHQNMTSNNWNQNSNRTEPGNQRNGEYFGQPSMDHALYM